MQESSRREHVPIPTLITGLLFMALLVVVDQFSKHWAEQSLKGRMPISMIQGVLEFRYLENTGAAFGILQGGTILFSVIAVIGIVILLAVFMKTPPRKRFMPFRILLVIIAAGALGNLIDRIFFHYVRDFIYISLINFPIFNVADMYVTIGVAFLLILILFFYREEDFHFLSSRSSRDKNKSEIANPESPAQDSEDSENS